MELAVVGAGYVGLVTALVFAQLGNKVRVVEIRAKRVSDLKAGKIHFYEPGLGEILLRHLDKNLFFTNDYSEAVSKAEVIFICVGTPTRQGRADLSFVYAAGRSIALSLKERAIVVVKSTVPPGTNRSLAKKMKKLAKNSFEVASVPEFLREGRALWDALHPMRVVIGAESKTASKKLLALHRPLPGKRVICSPESAQLIKYASNAFLPMKISFANSIAALCDRLGADVEDVLKGVGLDKRIGVDFLGAGIGYGGSCFPKDVAALIHLSQRHGHNFRLLKATAKTNEAQIDYFIKKIIESCQGDVKEKIITVLGLSFKPETSDMREARSIPIINELSRLGARVRVTDPVAISEAKGLISTVEFFKDPYEALTGAEAMVLVTEWKDYQMLDFKRVKMLMKEPVVLDGRNIYNRKQLEKLGFVYKGVGK